MQVFAGMVELAVLCRTHPADDEVMAQKTQRSKSECGSTSLRAPQVSHGIYMFQLNLRVWWNWQTRKI